jgi:hypothetical protein
MRLRGGFLAPLPLGTGMGNPSGAKAIRVGGEIA